MVERHETIGEVSVALYGVRGQLGTLWKVFGGIGATAAILVTGALGFLFAQLLTLNSTTALNTQALRDMTEQLTVLSQQSGQVVEGLDALKETASLSEPQPEAFADWTGIRIESMDAMAEGGELNEAAQAVFQSLGIEPNTPQAEAVSRALADGRGWLYVPSGELDRHIEHLPQ